MSPERRIAVTRAALVAVGALLLFGTGWHSFTWWWLPTLALAEAVALRTPARIMIGRQAAVVYSLNDAAMAIAFVLAPGPWIAIAAPLGYLVANVGRRPWSKLSFNLAQEFATVAAAVLVTGAVGGGVLGAVAGLATFAATQHLVVAVPIAATSRRPYGTVVRAMGALGALHTAGNMSVGVLAGWLITHEPVGLLGLIVPVGMLWWSYQQQTLRTSEAQLFAELARGQEKAAGGTVDASAEVVVTAAARLFGNAEVEMLLRHPDGPVRYLADGAGLTSRTRADGDAFDAPWVLRALSEGGVRVGQDVERPYCSAVLGDRSRPLAVLIARRPPRSGGFSRVDVQLTTVLVGQAEIWLSVADLTTERDEALGRAEAYGAASRVLGDIGQDTVPAVAVLRESAIRLSRLATAFAGPDAVGEIVQELHSVERAVASLLGAIAMASDPVAIENGDLVGFVGGTGGLGDTEWTTTGRLEDAVRL
jgi:hypothetical protein